MNPRADILADAQRPVLDRAADYFALTKPRVVAMVLVTTLAGFYLGGGHGVDLAFNLVLGTALAAGGTLALNQWMERESDAKMERTRLRPLPDGRLEPLQAAIFGLVLTVAGWAWLAAAVNPLTALIVFAVTVIYLLAYTPLKRVSWICNLVGAIPGALPPVAGWAAARGGVSLEPAVLFGIMFLWQLPHSLAIARLYRDDYARAGLWLLPADRASGTNPSTPVIVGASIALLIVGMAPTWLGFAGDAYLVVAAALGVAMVWFGFMMVRNPRVAAAARRVLMVSLVYLPVILLVLVLDRRV